MNIPDRDYMLERLRNEKPKTKSSSQYKIILFGIVALVLIANGIGLTKELKTPTANPTDSEAIKINSIVQSTAKMIQSIQQQVNPAPKSRVCKIKQNGEEECKFI